MRKLSRTAMALLAASTAGCATAPAIVAPRPAATVNVPSRLDPYALDRGAISAPERAVEAVGQSQQNPRLQELAQQVKNLDKPHQEAFAALMWQDLKTKTQQDLLLQARQWQQHPDLEVGYLSGLLSQVQAMSPQRAAQMAQTLPPGALQTSSPTAGGPQTQAVPPAYQSAFADINKRVKALSSPKEEALIGFIWQETKNLTTQDLWNQEQDWKANPQHQLAFLNHALTTIEQADDKTVNDLISQTPPEVLQAAAQAAKQAQGS